jgi:hypothetical protein
MFIALTECRISLYVGPRRVKCLRVPVSRVAYSLELFARESGGSFGANVQR